MMTLATALSVAVSLWVTGAPPSTPPAPDAAAEARVETVRFKSAAVGLERAYLVVLPPGYDPQRSRAYPVVYLLHGLGGAPKDWLEYARLDEVLTRAVREDATRPMVLVAPDGGNHYWTDHVGRPDAPGPRWGAFVADDVLADVEGRYHVRSDRGGRAIVGVSMGGHGALSIALQHPDRFGAAVSLAGALFPEPPTHRRIYKTVWGDPADAEHWARTSPIALMRTLSKATAPALFIQCGDDDAAGFLEYALLAHELLRERGVAHELRVNDGGHVWRAWTAATDEWLRFVDRSLTR